MAISMRWPEPTVRVLPRPVIAFRYETVQSFINRLAHANHLAPIDLRAYAAEPGNSHPSANRLASLSGYPRSVLFDRLRGLKPDERDATRQRVRSRPACRWCSARKGVFEPVHCWLPDHITVCPRHRRWIGPSARCWDDQASLTSYPEVLAAAAKHRRLCHRADVDRVEQAINEASRIVVRRRGLRGLTEHDSVNVSPQARWATGRHVGTHLATYRETVHLAAVIIDHQPRLLTTGNDESSVITTFLAKANSAFDIQDTDGNEALEWWLYDQRMIRRRLNRFQFMANR